MSTAVERVATTMVNQQLQQQKITATIARGKLGEGRERNNNIILKVCLRINKAMPVKRMPALIRRIEGQGGGGGGEEMRKGEREKG